MEFRERALQSLPSRRWAAGRANGDTHIFHVNKPLLNSKTHRFFGNFTRLEVFGDPESHWVRVTVNPSNLELFTIEPQMIPENRAKPRG